MPPIDKEKLCQLDKKTRDVFRHKGYTVETLLGAGNFGEVYKGVRIKTGEPCAVKMMAMDKMSPKFKERFLPRELAALMEMKHENIIRVWDIFKSNQKIFVFMEFASNGDILCYLKKHGAVSEERAQTWFTQLCKAVNYLHEELFTAHRDIKIDNILLNADWVAKLTDFGFAIGAIDKDGDIQKSETFCGTRPYFSPQLVLAQPYDPFKADVWASGVVLYTMTHNRFPFHSQDSKQFTKEQGDLDYKTSRLNRTLSKELKHILLALFEYEEATRPSMADVLKHRWIQLGKKSISTELSQHPAAHQKPLTIV